MEVTCHHEPLVLSEHSFQVSHPPSPPQPPHSSHPSSLSSLNCNSSPTKALLTPQPNMASSTSNTNLPAPTTTATCGEILTLPPAQLMACQTAIETTEQNSNSAPLSDYLEEEKPLLPGITVRAATFDQLVQLCVQSFSTDGCLIDDSHYPCVLLLMHKWFVSSQELAEHLVELYLGVEDHTECDLTFCSHTPTETACSLQALKAKVCHVFRYWIRTFPFHFDLDKRLKTIVERFGQILETEGNTNFSELIDLSKVPSYDWMRCMSVRNPSIRHSRKVSLVFDHLKPEELAEQLTCLEYKVFRRINFTDFKNYALTATLKDNPKLERSIALFNGLSQWVQCMVLNRTTPAQRAEVIVKFINVAQKLRSLQNFNTLMAVVGGLTHSALARLNKTNSCLSSDTQKLLMELTELLSTNNNFSNYRREYQQCIGFRVPILGVHLKDLISLHTALTDKVDGATTSLIHFRKMVQLYQIFKELTCLQNENLPLDANMDLINTLRLSLDMHYTEDNIYELSLAREPRSSLSAPATPTKPVVFADWVAGISPPDAETINKHVHNMVEAVFKNYDHDKDGFICNAEFEAIAGNFPFIDSFCVLDADKDGMISKTEMKTYFIRANCHSLRSNFKHDFHEKTYFQPTFCIHCTGLLWGLIKQGWKCKDCAINVHKHCKDMVVMECRPKLNSPRRHDSVFNDSEYSGYSSKQRMFHSPRHSKSHQGTQTDSDLIFSDSAKTLNQSTVIREEFYEEQSLLYDRLLKSEEEPCIEEEIQLEKR